MDLLIGRQSAMHRFAASLVWALHRGTGYGSTKPRPLTLAAVSSVAPQPLQF